jgi:hypothetical protein
MHWAKSLLKVGTSISRSVEATNCYLQARTDAGLAELMCSVLFQLRLARQQSAGTRTRVDAFAVTKRRLVRAAASNAGVRARFAQCSMRSANRQGGPVERQRWLTTFHFSLHLSEYAKSSPLYVAARRLALTISDCSWVPAHGAVLNIHTLA